LRDIVSAGVTLIDRRPSGGRLFIEDVCCGKMQMAGANLVTARQLDTEGGGVRILNYGSPFSVLGIKTEGASTVLQNRNGAKSDIFGGIFYVVRDSPGPEIPALLNEHSSLSASFAEESLRPTSRYDIFLRRDPQERKLGLPAYDLPPRGFGRFVPNLIDAP
jgi:hypothetical protein